VYQDKGEYDTALDWYNKSLKITEQIGDQAGIAVTYNNIGRVYKYKGDYDKALEWYLNSLKIKEQIGDRAGLATTYNQIGLIYQSKGDYAKALDYAEKALNISLKIGAEDITKKVRANIESIKAQKQKTEKLLTLPGEIEISDVTKGLEDNELGESTNKG
jgi:tetratricopeptide (TPR) repeat protein